MSEKLCNDAQGVLRFCTIHTTSAICENGVFHLETYQLFSVHTKRPVLSSCTGSQEPIQKTQQCSTAKQRFINKGVQWLFPLCTGTPGHNQTPAITGLSGLAFEGQGNHIIIVTSSVLKSSVFKMFFIHTKPSV